MEVESAPNNRPASGKPASAAAAAPSNPFAGLLRPEVWGGAAAADDDADDDADGGGGGGGGVLGSARSLIEEVLESVGYAEQRAAKMDLDDFMRLLAAFNKAGVHFTNGSLEGSMVD